MCTWSNHRLYIHNGENKRELKKIAPNCVMRSMGNSARTKIYDCIKNKMSGTYSRSSTKL